MFDSLFRKFQGERRWFLRKKSHNLVLISATVDQPTMVNLLDLSESGLQFTSRRPMRRNKKISLEINLTELNRQVQVAGRIVWSKMVGDIYRVGVAFTEVSEESSEILHSYLFRREAA